ncbi:Tetratricopeptide TPR_1 repeat-containing protein [Emticicia oligotrophica DSM 17448]|uniref:Tetratricopeptide TPR_1 repeat-containing protein n=1 Tax=Emticicia oligotrophica (strain DSM 17448 / CIP 109782 / MTCC 6937 / GPTSA100-15) TaxID=929562 RepID=A0ABM5N073_EMTOG|nr:tetratricopeptide repeat protein [Emticicia oligotrophica]AFK02783.1 Tetratricopeptide TPR_1 repeat-containing protein [Emticicia oligotrophica DSM 17448]
MKFRPIIYLVFVALPILSVAQKNKKTESKDISEKELKSEAYFVEGMKYYIAESYDKAIPLFKKATEGEPTSAGINYMLAKAYLASNDIATATVYSEKALKLDDENKFYRKFLGEIYTKQKRYKDAAEMYEKLASRFPQDVDNYLDLSNIYILQEKFSDAIEIYNKIERTIGVSEEITRQKQLIYLKQNKLEKAIEEGDRLIASEPSEPEYVVQQAQILISNERYEQAITMLRNSLKKNPDFAEAHVLLAEIYRKQNELEKCNEELQEAFANKNLSVDVKFKILNSYMLMLKDDSSNKTLDNLLTLTQALVKQSPKEAKGYVILGDLLMKKGETASARDNYVKSTTYDKSVFEVWLAIVELDAKLNQIDSLAKHSEEAIEYFPNQSFFWYHNGFANFAKKDYEKASSSLEEAKNLAVDNLELAKHVNALLGDTYNELKKYTKSDDAYEAVLKVDPDYEYVLNNYSYYLSIRKDKLSRAIQLSSRLTDKFGDNATYLDTHAWVLYMMKEYQKAREFLERAIKQDKGVSGTIVEHYGDVLYRLGEKEKALEQWKKARQMGENSTNIDKKIQSGTLVE